MRVIQDQQQPSKSSSSKMRISLQKRSYHDDDDIVQISDNNIYLNDVVDRINVMKISEEGSYHKEGFFKKWEDHLTNKNHQPIPTIVIEGEECYISKVTRPDNSDLLNEFYRSFMCKWSFQLIDYLQDDREVVSVAFSYVDKLLESYYFCTKQVFRLAIVTSIYLAINLLTSTEIPLEQVTNLCRNEFTTKMVVQMEMIILQTFNYNLHPPTSKSFIEHLCAFLPMENVSISTKEYIIQQSYFLVELSTYDYYFVDQKPSAVAFAAIANVIEGLDLDSFGEIPRYTFIHHMSKILDIYSRSECIATIQHRIDGLYKNSKQYTIDTTSNTSVSTSKKDSTSVIIVTNTKDFCMRRCSSELELSGIIRVRN